ncbi:ShlB/FhaC/HecB family hemolysin secretion/activation protein [Arcobacter sp. FWKO B]|uniref:ShlB/FhaC/HecB family hemolysin secretion/activation protein n=1 Tax=Arcobacter sp. FWKO B TaxID=2593672 RepID=UPI0018A4AF8F|nr:ShlB/FhaC/HecB family hemolysin secretion/activation protein [Arcobacter sp. FWKO B]QOG11712.1 ShlB/FhaC/HecB family hemolysin secretion/activation protein [Arcobacter sp. FWKO B]
MKKLITLSFITASSLLAQPTITDIEKSISTPKEVETKAPSLVEVGGKEKYAPVMADDESGKTIEVKDFSIEGNTQIKDDVLKKLLSEYVGKPLTFSQLQETASLITKYYREKGYFVARAYIPIQDIKSSNGIVKIAVIEGNYGEFKLTNNSKVKDSIVQAMFDDAKTRGNIVSTNTLERSMLIINDTPGVMVTQADVRPGKEVGTSDFIVTTEPSAPYSGYIVADNYGSKYTSVYRTMAGGSINNPFKIGDKLTLSGLYGMNSNLDNYKASYSFPILPNGLRGEIAYSETNYKLEKKYVTNQDIKGDSQTLEATLSYPIIRTRVQSLYTTFTYTSKDMKDTNDGVQTNKKTLESFNLGLNYTKSALLANLDTQYNASINLISGKLNIKDATAKTQDTSGAKTNGSYEKLALTLANTTILHPKISLETSLTYQQALNNKNLDGSEDMSIGGSNGVRVYPDSEESAENGYIIRAESFYTLPSYKGLDHKVSLFVDTAKVKQENNTTNEKARQLSDIGIGYHTSYKNFFAKAHIATIIGNSKVTSEADNKQYKTKFLVQAGMVF